jgi:hypothetical protein
MMMIQGKKYALYQSSQTPFSSTCFVSTRCIGNARSWGISLKAALQIANEKSCFPFFGSLGEPLIHSNSSGYEDKKGTNDEGEKGKNQKIQEAVRQRHGFLCATFARPGWLKGDEQLRI